MAFKLKASDVPMASETLKTCTPRRTDGLVLGRLSCQAAPHSSGYPKIIYHLLSPFLQHDRVHLDVHNATPLRYTSGAKENGPIVNIRCVSHPHAVQHLVDSGRRIPSMRASGARSYSPVVVLLRGTFYSFHLSHFPFFKRSTTTPTRHPTSARALASNCEKQTQRMPAPMFSSRKLGAAACGGQKVASGARGRGTGGMLDFVAGGFPFSKFFLSFSFSALVSLFSVFR